MTDRAGFESQHFSLNNPQGEEQGDIPMLLRRLASTLEEMGRIDIRDLILHNDLDEDGDPWPYITVYFSPLPDEEEEPS